MNHKFLFLIVFVFSSSVSAQGVLSDANPRASKLVQTYCVTCHNENLKTANLLLDAAVDDPIDQLPATWEKVARRLKARSMPPQGMPRPNEDDYMFLIWSPNWTEPLRRIPILVARFPIGSIGLNMPMRCAIFWRWILKWINYYPQMRLPVTVLIILPMCSPYLLC